MKKQIGLLLCAALLLSALSGCAGAPAQSAAPSGSGRPLRVVATIFPVYDWAREVLGERLGDTELTLLLDDGADLHSYQPTVDDMVKIGACDVFLYVGGESDEWVGDALRGTANDERIALNLLETLGDAAKEEEHLEGMQEDPDHPHDHDEDQDHGHSAEEPEYDEHIWLSLRNAAALCQTIADAFGAADPDHREAYARNAAAYGEKLAALDAQIAAAVEAAPHRALLFGDRFPFRYLADDYGLEAYAAFSGCSAETEASFETVVFLANKVDELGLPAVLTLESSDGRIARTIVENTGTRSAQILRMDSMQSVTAQEAAQGKTYLGAMEENFAVLRQALQ